MSLRVSAPVIAPEPARAARPAEPLAAHPSAEGMLSWLLGGAVLGEGGAVLSWDNPAHPGYAYPEAAGLLLALLSQEQGAGSAQATRLGASIAARLAREVSPAGGVGRGGCDYVFDTAVVLAALLDHTRRGAPLPDPTLPRRLFDFLASALADRVAFRGEPEGPPGHWSRAYGAHLLKVVIALDAYGEVFDDPRCEPLIEQLHAELAPLGEGGRFVIHAASNTTYLHACCYAVEGLLALERRGRSTVTSRVRASAAWLARAQDPSGGLPAFHDGERASGPLRADATAQAVRIWQNVDARGHAEAIARGLTFLAQVQTPAGGLRYEPGSNDVNTWVTIFAVQALRAVQNGGEEARWIA